MQKSVLQGHKIWSGTLLKTLLVMKLAIIIILATTIQLHAAPIMGQHVNLQLKQTEIKKVLKLIESDGYYRFLYNSKLKALKQTGFFCEKSTIDRIACQIIFGK
ncbi:MAG: hypothetical protein IPG38_00695 [Chitinophagaceae bacterium]|nr:hypothetical protein [Chitinophagaceae bacterium]